MSETKHTPLPWRVRAGHLLIETADHTGRLIADANWRDGKGEGEANARLIVAAVNDYDRLRASNAELLAALREALATARRGLEITVPASIAFVEFATLETSLTAALDKDEKG